MKALIIIILAACFASCNTSHYSPLDTYLNTRHQSDSLKEVSRVAAQSYIDSIKGAHIVIHNTEKF